MYAEVVVPRRVHKSFTYAVPERLRGQIRQGQRVMIPFGRERLTGYVVEIASSTVVPRCREIAELVDKEPLLTDELMDLARWLSTYYLCPLGLCLSAILPPSPLAYPPPDPSLRSGGEGRVGGSPLVRGESASGGWGEGEAMAIASIRQGIESGKGAVYLLQAPPGRERKEIYFEVVRLVRDKGRQSILLAPEIVLATSLYEEVLARCGPRVALLHSGLSGRERRDAWGLIREGRVDVVIGTRSALFAPFPRLGLIVVDDEQDPSYKQEEKPRYHARDVAVMRGKKAGATVVLGSEAPSLESFYNSLVGKYHRLTVPALTPERLPRVTIVDLRDERGKGTMWFTGRLRKAIEERLKEKEQTMLLVNRRGYYSLLLCQDCSQGLSCPQCAVTLTYHRQRGLSREPPKGLLCHYCGYMTEPPRFCPNCKGTRIIGIGTGTQQVEEVIRKMFPAARVARMDRDTVRRKKSSPSTQDAAQDHADIFVGTQMMERAMVGVSRLTLVGVVCADTTLQQPDFRSAERAFQVLTHAIGLVTGQGDRGEVIIQTYSPSHYAVTASARRDYEGFAAEELRCRKDLRYPPFSRCVLITVEGRHPTQVSAIATSLAGVLRKIAPRESETLGPAPAPLSRLRGRERLHILLKGRRADLLTGAVQKALEMTSQKKQPSIRQVKVEVDVDPQRF